MNERLALTAAVQTAVELFLASVDFMPNGVELRCLSHFFMTPS